jgi:hypothetical protein
MNEQDCLNALTGRVIKSAKFKDESCEEIIIETQDGLTFEIEGGSGHFSPCDDFWVSIEQVTSE